MEKETVNNVLNAMLATSILQEEMLLFQKKFGENTWKENKLINNYPKNITVQNEQSSGKLICIN